MLPAKTPCCAQPPESIKCVTKIFGEELLIPAQAATVTSLELSHSASPVAWRRQCVAYPSSNALWFLTSSELTWTFFNADLGFFLDGACWCLLPLSFSIFRCLRPTSWPFRRHRPLLISLHLQASSPSPHLNPSWCVELIGSCNTSQTCQPHSNHAWSALRSLLESFLWRKVLARDLFGGCSGRRGRLLPFRGGSKTCSSSLRCWTDLNRFHLGSGLLTHTMECRLCLSQEHIGIAGDTLHRRAHVNL